MIAVAIFLTYALQFYVPFEIIWNGIKHRFTSRSLLIEYTFRVSLALLTSEWVAIILIRVNPSAVHRYVVVVLVAKEERGLVGRRAIATQFTFLFLVNSLIF